MASGYSRLMDTILDFFIPKEKRSDPIVYRTSRIHVAIFLITACLWFVYIPSVLKIDFRYQEYVDANAGFLCLLAAVLYKYGVHIGYVVHVYMFGAGGGILVGCLMGGALSSTSALLLIPATTMLLAGVRHALIWFCICIVFLSVIYYMTMNGFEFKLYFHEKYLEQLQFTGTLGMLVALFLNLLVFENEKNRAMESLVGTNADLRVEKKRSEDLLLNILPEEVAEELKEHGKAKPKSFDDVSVLFTDVVNFTGFSEKVGAEELVEEIDHCFKKYDHVNTKHNMEKIKTIGDSYMAVAGLPVETLDHGRQAVEAAVEIMEFMEEYRKERIAEGKPYFVIRIGINSGPVVAGIVGFKKFAYDIWGDTVNMAARMEEASEVNKINISGTTYELVKDKFACVYRGKVKAKNKGEIDMYFVEKALL
jgi:class 3 adenylate cyclase